MIIQVGPTSCLLAKCHLTQFTLDSSQIQTALAEYKPRENRFSLSAKPKYVLTIFNIEQPRLVNIYLPIKSFTEKPRSKLCKKRQKVFYWNSFNAFEILSPSNFIDFYPELIVQLFIVLLSLLFLQ